MQIKKVNNDKLKIILTLNDLDEKNIDIDSFLANPIESQNLFFEILDLAEEKFNFDIQNNKAVVEAISLDNNMFILTITKLKNDFYTYNNNSKIYCFETIEDLLSLYSVINNNNINIHSLNIFEFGNKYYFILNKENECLENFLLEFSYPLNSYFPLDDILAEYGNKINK